MLRLLLLGFVIGSFCTYWYYNNADSIPFNNQYTEQDVIATSSNHYSYCVISLVTDKKSSMAVFVDDQQHHLERGALGSKLLHCGNVPVAKDNYYYAMVRKGKVIDREPFIRQPHQEPTVLKKNNNQAVHDFYNRTQNVYPVTPLPQLYRPLSVIQRIPTDPHVEGEIATIHLVADQSEIDAMHQDNMERIKVNAKMFYISSTKVQVFDHTVVRISGRSTRELPKLSYELKILKEEKQTLQGFRRLKLRSLYTDPSYVREDLAHRTLHSLGLPTSSFSYVRVFVNDQAIGLFGLIESYSAPWVNAEFGYGRSWYRQGVMYQARGADTWLERSEYIGDLRYNGDLEQFYAKGQYRIKANPSLGEASYIPLARLTRFIAYAPTLGSPCTVAAWQRHFNMESVLRSLALEVVAGFADGYITLADNYILYQNGPYSSQFVFIPADVDSTFGQTLTNFSEMLSGDYTAYPGYQDRAFMQRVLRVPQYKDRFEYLLKELATQLINMEVMERTINDVTNMIREDIEWDKSLPNVHPYQALSLCGQFLKSPPSSDGSDNRGGAQTTGINFPVDFDMLRDMCLRFRNQDVSFEDGINGPTEYQSLLGVKEFIRMSSEAVRKFYTV